MIETLREITINNMVERNERIGVKKERGACVCVWFGIFPSASLLSRYVHLFDHAWVEVGVELFRMD